MRDAPRLKDPRPLRADPVDEPAEGERKQRNGPERNFEHLNPRLGERVVGRFLVRG